MLEELEEEPSTLKSSQAQLQPPAMLEHKIPPLLCRLWRPQSQPSPAGNHIPGKDPPSDWVPSQTQSPHGCQDLTGLNKVERAHCRSPPFLCRPSPHRDIPPQGPGPLVFHSEGPVTRHHVACFFPMLFVCRVWGQSSPSPCPKPARVGRAYRAALSERSLLSESQCLCPEARLPKASALPHSQSPSSAHPATPASPLLQCPAFLQGCSPGSPCAIRPWSTGAGGRGGRLGLMCFLWLYRVECLGLFLTSSPSHFLSVFPGITLMFFLGAPERPVGQP